MPFLYAKVQQNIVISKFFDLNISVNSWDMGLIFLCDHNFYRFQNNFEQNKVSWRSFIDFQGVAISAPPPSGFWPSVRRRV